METYGYFGNITFRKTINTFLCFFCIARGRTAQFRYGSRNFIFATFFVCLWMALKQCNYDIYAAIRGFFRHLQAGSARPTLC